MSRRKFAFWIGLCLFWTGRRLRAEMLDTAAASLMEWSEPARTANSKVERWRPNANRRWRWFERQTQVNGQWKLSGVTTPVDHRTGATYSQTTEPKYLDPEMVPESVRNTTAEIWRKLNRAKANTSVQFGHGQPPSRWLRNLNAAELRLWLKTIRVPEVGVEGMTVWTHLTRDHSFSPGRIQGLSQPEMAKLHAAAHYGY